MIPFMTIISRYDFAQNTMLQHIQYFVAIAFLKPGLEQDNTPSILIYHRKLLSEMGVSL